MIKRLKVLFILVLGLCLSLSLSGCKDKNEPTGSLEVEDMLGRKLNITPGSYQRVICIGAGALRMYCYIGDVSLLAGVEDIDNSSLSERPKMFDGVARPYFIANEEAFKSLPSCGVGGPQSQVAETEKILACNPDIIISEYEDIDKANSLQELVGVPVVVIKYGNKGIFDENVKKTITLLGKIFDKEQKAKTLNDYIASSREEIERRVKDVTVSEQKKVYIAGLGNWGTTNHLMTAQNYEPFNIAKINNIVTDLAKDGIQAIEAEKFLSLAPQMDVMILDAAAIKNIKGLYKDDNTMFDACKAWEDDEVYLQMAYNAYYTNLEIALCNTWFNAKVIYPELFSDIDINAKLDEITEAFLGVKLASKINSYPMSYGGYGKLNKEVLN